MTEQNNKAISRYGQYHAILQKSCSFEYLKKEIQKLENQEFIMIIPIGGAANGR